MNKLQESKLYLQVKVGRLENRISVLKKEKFRGPGQPATNKQTENKKPPKIGSRNGGIRKKVGRPFKVTTARIADQDRAKARQLLKGLRVKAELPIMSDLARACEFRLRDADRYEFVGDTFCDGIGVELLNVRKQAALAHKVGLLNAIHEEVGDWVVRNILVTNRRKWCYLWITLDPACSQLDGMMVTRLRQMEQAITIYAQRLLTEPGDAPADARISKFDLARDSRGSFLPEKKK